MPYTDPVATMAPGVPAATIARADSRKHRNTPGMFTRWTRALTDPLPVVVRDPGSRLSRQYSEAVSNLLRDAASDARTGLTAVST